MLAGYAGTRKSLARLLCTGVLLSVQDVLQGERVADDADDAAAAEEHLRPRTGGHRARPLGLLHAGARGHAARRQYGAQGENR